MPHNTSSTTMVNGTEVDVADLEVIDFSRLAANEPAEVEKLYKASKSPGFFYLDLTGEDRYLGEVRNMYSLSDKYFDQPLEVKMKDCRESEERGFQKPTELDGEFDFPYDDAKNGNLILPAVLKDHAEFIKQFITFTHHVSTTILSHLSNKLGIPFGESHRADQPSSTILKLCDEPLRKTLADVEENKHTDGGSLTTMFCDEWGTQIQYPDTGKWAFVQPKNGCAVINIANSLQKLSGGELYSCVHRVTQPTDGAQKRPFIWYFLRPETATNLYS
ncbi:hypothetical protein DFP73DRAFT_561694 [Morchella snyderi]|nr:hypothetical protein DFP73DRAFT_561694 [Morchella snyderi]